MKPGTKKIVVASGVGLLALILLQKMSGSGSTSGGGSDGGGGILSYLPDLGIGSQPGGSTTNVYLPGGETQDTPTKKTATATNTSNAIANGTTGTGLGDGGIGGGFGGGSGGARGDEPSTVKKALSYTAPGVIYDSITKGSNAYSNLAQSVTNSVMNSKTVMNTQTAVKKAVAVIR